MHSDEHYMQRAIELAARGAGHVAPNPMVGAVLVHEGRIIGEGWHAAYGDVHAEVACLQSVQEEAQALIPSSTMYVTLEPCAHQGRQPPCAARLLQERIGRVVVAVEDPFPEVAGRGITMLRDSGIAVSVGCCKDEASWMSRRFLHAQIAHRPYVILKWAQSLDAFIAPTDGRRYQLSNQFSHVLVHKWRTEESAIMVGYNTALADNPQLTSRHWKGIQPLRIALDKHLRLPASHHLLDDSTATWIVNELIERSGVTSNIRIPFDEILLPELLQRLLAAGKTSLIVEGGAKLLHTFTSLGLWDEARVLQTPKILGNGLPAPILADARHAVIGALGDDILHLYQPHESRYPYSAGPIL